MPLNPNSPVKNFYASSSLQSTNGKIYFGGNNGYVEIDIHKNGFSPEKPQTYISGIHLNNKQVYYNRGSKILQKDIAFTNNLKLKYKDNTLMLDFSTLDFWMPEKTIYRYRMVDYDDNWQITEGEKNFAVYSNISPGKYEFEVAGANHNGLWDDTPARLKIRISPPIWLSKGFLFIYFLLIAGIIYGTLRFLNYRHRIAHELKIAHLEKIHSEQLLQAKQQFFTNISHEFRTPLSLIVPPLQQIIKSNNLDEIQKRLLSLAGKNSQRLLQLVNQILDFRKMETTELKLTPSKFELISFCKNIYQSFTDLAKRNEIDYQYITDLPPCMVLFDEAKIETILFNLLSNAFKHTPPGGEILLKLNKTENNTTEQIEISVSDTGKGIPREEQENIFKRFYQTDSFFDMPKTGTGIGLTMALEYAQLHKGTILVNSTPGSGSIFTLTLPFQPITEEALPPNESLREVSPKGRELFSPETHTHNKTILIIDDNPDILEYIELNLGMHYKFIRAENGKKGLEKAKKEMPDLIVSDVMMPVMDGLELCQKLKKPAQTAAIPVILLTAKSLDAQKIEGMTTGADLYITKPFDTGYLYSCIESLFRREHILQDYIRSELLVQAPAGSTPSDNQDHIFIRKVMDIIEKNIDNNHLSVNLISHEIGISTTHLYRKLMDITRQPTKDIIKNYRLQKAAQMLKNNEGNVTEVMYAVGFSSLSSFSKSFKAMYGYSPSEYARKND
jgi:signal transduction histidine kinase/DNA-binding response OmpR family regulator